MNKKKWIKYFKNFYSIHPTYAEAIRVQLQEQIEEIVGVKIPWHRFQLFEPPVGDLRTYSEVDSRHYTHFTQSIIKINHYYSYPIKFFWYTKNTDGITDTSTKLLDPDNFVVKIESLKRVEKMRDFIRNNTFDDLDKIMDCDTTFKVVIKGGTLTHEGFVKFDLTNFEELPLIDQCEQDVVNLWSDKSYTGFGLPPEKRGTFDHMRFDFKNEKEKSAIYFLQFGHADTVILKHIMERISEKCSTVLEVTITGDIYDFEKG